MEASKIKDLLKKIEPHEDKYVGARLMANGLRNKLREVENDS